MIYILNKPYNQGLYEQWIDVVDRTNLPYEVIVFNREEADLKFPNYLGNKKTLNFLKNKIKTDDLLLIDSAFFQPIEGDVESNIKYIQKELGCKIIVFHPDTGFDTKLRFGDKVKVLSPTYHIDEDVESKKDSYNFYLVNGGYQELRWLAETVWLRYREMLRYKKFLSHNGVYKLQRTLIYKTLKENNLLKDSFFSYNAYNIFDDNINHNKDEDTKYENHIIENIEPIYSKTTHEELLKDLPIVLDYIPNLSNVDQYAFTLPYTSNAYIELIGCTTIDSSDVVYTSEKIFKPFMAFMIPVFVGPSNLCKTLQQLGFDLFDDIIDLSYDEEIDTVKRLSMVMEEIKKLGKYSIQELHNLYWDREQKLRHNHQLMQELARNQVETIRGLLEPHKNELI